MNYNNTYSNKNNNIIYSIINPFIIKVYSWMSFGLILTSFTSWYLTKIPSLINLFYNNQSFLFSIIILQLIIVYFLSNMIYFLSKNIAVILFVLYSILTGITLSSIFYIYTFSSIYIMFLITSLMFIFMTIYGLFTENDLTNLGSLLLMLLFGILISSTLNILIKNTFLMHIISYINIFVFIGLISYDTQKLKDLGNNLSYSNKEILNKYAVLGALILYLDFINLFLSPLKMIDKKNDKNEN